MSMPPAQQGRLRVRTGTAILLIGMVLVLWAWGNWVYRLTPRGDAPHPTRAPTAGGAPPANTNAAPVTTPAIPSTSGAAGSSASDSKAPDQKRTAARMALVVVIGGVVIVAVFVGAIALARAARRWRAAASRRRLPPSITGDVWALHQAPELEDEDTEDEMDP